MKNAQGPARTDRSKTKLPSHAQQQRMSAEGASVRSVMTEPPTGRSQILSMFRTGFRPTSYLSVLRLSTLSQLLLDDDTERLLHRIGYGFMLLGTLLVSGATALERPWVKFLEWETQTFFFQRRGVVTPPQDIVILEMDEASLSQSQFYVSDPENYPFLAPISQWPWQRTAYAIAIDHLMQSGARAVGIDVIFDSPSAWGEADDEFLRQTLQHYPGRVVLASHFDDAEQEIGSLFKFLAPLPQLTEAGALSGFIDYPLEINGRIHQFSQVWLAQNMATDPTVQLYLDALPPSSRQPFSLQSFRAAEGGKADSNVGSSMPLFRPLEPGLDSKLDGQQAIESVTEDIGNQIDFYGPEYTFSRQSFWTVIDPDSWQAHLQNQTFRNKIVLIGPTAELFNDFHRTPYGLMPGVEIHANAIANYLDHRAIRDAIAHPYGRGLFVFFITLMAGTAISAPRRMIHRAVIAVSIVVAWAGICYGLWWWGHLVFPTAIPLGAIALIGTGYVVSGLVRGKLKLRGLLRRYLSSPIVQDIISRQDDLQDLISAEEREAIGKKLDGRYEIIEVLGSGGFGQTFTASDLRRPGQPKCVVKQLRPVTNDPQVFHLSRRLFQREAETLERLGSHHDQIPQLLAYFEEAQEFYLVQELIEGRPLHHELRIRYPFSDRDIILLLKELLEILVFIHGCGVIHRDIKPSNVIRRHADQKLVLIDFGAVKEIQGPATANTADQTVSIGTRGYMPNEQLAGSPRLNSDIYAVGVIGIQASTKLSPEQLNDDPRTGELAWHDHSTHSTELKNILDKMTRYDFSRRYQTVQEVLQDLELLLVDYPSKAGDRWTHLASAPSPSIPHNWPSPSDLASDLKTMPVGLETREDELDDTGEDEYDDDDDRYYMPTLPWHTDLKPALIGSIEDEDDEGNTNPTIPLPITPDLNITANKTTASHQSEDAAADADAP